METKLMPQLFKSQCKKRWQTKIMKNSFGEGVCGGLQVLYRFGCRKEGLSMLKWSQQGTKNHQNGAKRVTKVTNTEPKGCQTEPRNLQRCLLRKRVEKGSKKGVAYPAFGSHFVSEIYKKCIRKFIQKSIAKNIQNNAKREPQWRWIRRLNSLKINAKTATGKMRKIMTNHVFLNCKN